MRTFTILFFICAGIIVQAQNSKRIGLILDIDTLMNHNYLGVTKFENKDKTYKLPFDLRTYVYENLHEYFTSIGFEVIELDDTFKKELDSAWVSIKKLKDYKAYLRKRYAEVLQAYELNNIVFFENPEVSGGVNPGNITMQFDGFGIINYTSKKFGIVYFPWELKYIKNDHFNIIYEKPSYLKIKGLIWNKDKETRFTTEEIMSLEPHFKALIDLQMEKLKNNPSIAGQIIESSTEQ